jgi:hypothetical protein
MEFHKPSVWLRLLWKTFRGPSHGLNQCEQLNMEDLFHQDMSIIVQRFRGQWSRQREERYLRKEIRRRALRGFVASCLAVVSRSFPGDFVEDYFQDRPIKKPTFWGHDDSYSSFVTPEVDVFLCPLSGSDYTKRNKDVNTLIMLFNKQKKHISNVLILLRKIFKLFP